ncbi:hypothetical protein ACFO0N_18850 [Halobium salinum]|uniref:DUF4386 family protein n=1 Tax=Halobium salinum TaxID=1364940 RepID=A0ABD5PH39_9EURY|nr:hypothetical protein [Halobium salinum]
MTTDTVSDTFAGNALRIRAAGGASLLGALLMTFAVLRRATADFTNFGPVDDGVLFDVQRVVFRVDNGVLVLSIALLFIGLLGLWTRQQWVSGWLWNAGIAATGGGFILALLSAVAQTAFVGSDTALGGVVGIGFALGNFLFFMGGLPLGLALYLQAEPAILKIAGLALMGAGPSLSMAAMFYTVNTVLGALLFVGPIATAWGLVGYYLVAEGTGAPMPLRGWA